MAILSECRDDTDDMLWDIYTEGQDYSRYQSKINNINKNWLPLGIIKSFVCDIGFELLYFYHLTELYHNLNYTSLRVTQY